MEGKALAGLAALTLFDIAVAVAPAAAQSANDDWAGFYIGGHGGYRWAHARLSEPAYAYDNGNVVAPSYNQRLNMGGFIAGIQVGYNYMLNKDILIGVEGDWTWGWGHGDSDIAFSEGSGADSFSFYGHSRIKLPWQATIRGRLGYVKGAWLFYGTGGIAFARVSWHENDSLNESVFRIVRGSTVLVTTNSAFSWDADRTLIGGAVGGGIEYKLTAHWIVRAEYLYESFGSFSVSFGFGPQTGRLKLDDVNKLRFGISYKF